MGVMSSWHCIDPIVFMKKKIFISQQFIFIQDLPLYKEAMFLIFIHPRMPGVKFAKFVPVLFKKKY